MQNVSRETLADNLSLYVSLLLKWQQKINLISSKTADEIMHRHINDSLQLQPLIPSDTATIIDLGSGAGLPGIPLALTTGIKTYLVESDKRKSVFMQEAIRQLQIDASVINMRIEEVHVENITHPVVITARALAGLNEIFKLIYSLLDKNNLHEYKILLLKGKNVSRETLGAEANWTYAAEYVKSKTDDQASIMIITALKPR